MSDSESLMAEDSPHIQLNEIMISVCLNDAGICVSEYKCVCTSTVLLFSEYSFMQRLIMAWPQSFLHFNSEHHNNEKLQIVNC